MVASMGIHGAAARGYAVASETYERGRPDYPPAAIEHLVRMLGLRDGVSILDLGAGTGKLTRLLQFSGARLVAVEPVEAMRQTLAEKVPGVTVLDGTAEAIPLADQSVHAVTIAQAFHWFDGVRALRELHRVLEPSGRVGLVWNVRDESVEWVARLTELVDPYEGDAPRYRNGKWRIAFN